jgi:hypothetical protein
MPRHPPCTLKNLTTFIDHRRRPVIAPNPRPFVKTAGNGKHPIPRRASRKTVQKINNGSIETG